LRAESENKKDISLAHVRATDIKHEASPQTWGSGGDDAFMVALMAVSWAGQASGGGGGG
jgi:hypothetical protein